MFFALFCFHFFLIHFLSNHTALKKMDIKARNSSQIRQQRFDALAALTAPPTTALTFEGGQGGEAREGEEVGFGGGLVEGKKRKEREGEEGKNKEGEGSPSEKRPKLERNEPSSSSSSSSSLVPTPPKETPREYNCPGSLSLHLFLSSPPSSHPPPLLPQYPVIYANSPSLNVTIFTMLSVPNALH